MSAFRQIVPLLFVLVLGGCAAPQPYDYTAYRANRPASIVVLPVLNSSLEVAAGYAVLSRATYPLAEAGYYVFPVALVDETFKQNGLTAAHDIHNVPLHKLREIFGADAALYLEVTEYGASYKVVSSEVRVTAKARLVDLRSGDLLWAGESTASTAEDQNQGGSSNVLGVLISAVVNQIINTVDEDLGYRVAGITTQRLLGAHNSRGLLYGSRSPKYQSD